MCYMDGKNSRNGNQSNDAAAGWIPVKLIDESGQFSLDPEFEEMRVQRSYEQPDIEPFKNWLLRTYASQSGVELQMETATPEQLREFVRWMGFQQFDGDLMHCFVRKWPRLDHFMYETFTGKISAIAQRACYICKGARPIGDAFPIAQYVMRITPISRQASRDDMFTRFQAAFRSHFENKLVEIGKSGKVCLAVTFILNQKKQDRDVDNMVKAVQDAFCRAITVHGRQFDDRFVHHLDVVKLLFADTEEWLYLRIAPSFLSEHDDVVAPIHNHGWGGAERIELGAAVKPAKQKPARSKSGQNQTIKSGRRGSDVLNKRI